VGEVMPESLRQRIENAIVQAQDEAQRVMLMLMLSMFDTTDDTRNRVSDVSATLDKFVGDFVRHDKWEREWREAHFKGIGPDDHVDQHGVVKQIVIERRQSAEVIHEAKKGFAGQVGKTAAIAVFSLITGAVGALKLFGGG
jgi:hypothetical protein